MLQPVDLIDLISNRMRMTIGRDSWRFVWTPRQDDAR